MSGASEPTIYHACELVLMESCQGDGKRTVQEDQITIPFRTLQFVIEALKNADAARRSEC